MSAAPIRFKQARALLGILTAALAVSVAAP